MYGDICGPITPFTLGGSTHFLLLIDDYPRLIRVSMLKRKLEAFLAFKKCKEHAEKEKETKLKCFRTDHGGEFMSKESVKFCDEHGINRQLIVPYSPNKNGVVERKNRIFMSMARSMMKEKELPLDLWGEAINPGVHNLNRSPTRSL